MVERVARAIFAKLAADPDWDHTYLSQEECFEIARAAIEAMKEPTAAMIDASSTVSLEMGSFCTVTDQYKAMLRRALEA